MDINWWGKTTKSTTFFILYVVVVVLIDRSDQRWQEILFCGLREDNPLSTRTDLTTHVRRRICSSYRLFTVCIDRIDPFCWWKYFRWSFLPFSSQLFKWKHDSFSIATDNPFMLFDSQSPSLLSKYASVTVCWRCCDAAQITFVW
jgi:hypothetical protein